MITTRRRINTDRTVYENTVQPTDTSLYATQDNAFDTDITFRTVDEPSFERAPARDRSMTAQPLVRDRDVATQAPAETEPVVRYSTRSVYNGAYAVSAPAPAPATGKAKKTRNQDELMMRIQPPASDRQESKEEARPATNAKMSGKTRAALIAYVASVVILAAIVIATGLAVSNLNAQSAKIEQEIVAKNEQLAQINSDIALYTDLDRITGAAVNNGMQKIESAVEVDLLPTAEPVTYKGRTNWFDKFCDWLSKIIGG